MNKPLVEFLTKVLSAGSGGGSGDKDEGGVELINNNIYFYSEVDRNSVLSLSKKITDLNNSFFFKKEVYGLGELPKINIRINSYGGLVFDSFTAVNCIKNSKAPVTTIIDGYAASGATLFSVVGKERYMKEYSFMLIHQLSSGMWGKFEEQKDEMKNNQLLMDNIYKIYEEHTKLPKRKLKEVLKKDLWFSPKECIAYGLVDDVLTE